MDLNATEDQVLSGERRSDANSVLDITWDKWRAREMVFTPEKLKWLWDSIKGYRTLFSDLTRGNPEPLINSVLAADSFWVEVTDQDGKIVGVLYLTNTAWVIDASVHIIFFDRKPREKAMLCRLVMEWAFRNFPLQRLSIMVPSIYWMTIRMAKDIGFSQEGIRRRAYLIGNKWVDETMLGILRSEVL